MRIFFRLSILAVLAGLPVYGQHIHVMDEVVVTANSQEPTETVMPRGRIPSGTEVNAAEAASRVPGVSTVTRSANSAEPVIRGLGWERVVTQLEGIPLYGSCPARMDPPSTYVSPEILSEVRVVKALPSVTLGPGATGGQILLSTDVDRGPNAGRELQGGGDLSWNEGRDGYQASAHGQGGSSSVDVRVGASLVDLDNYTGANGQEVPARLEEHGASAAFGWRTRENHRLNGGYIYRKIDGADFPSLPMDTDSSAAHIAYGGYEILTDSGPLEGLELRLGYANIDHEMSNREKPNRGKLEASTESESESMTLSLGGDLRVEELLLSVGADYAGFRRDALRRRFFPGTGKTSLDAIWPDGQQDMIGVYAETSVGLTPDLVLRVGGRVDGVQSDADAPSTAGYERFYGPDAADLKADEVLVSGNLLAEWTQAHPLSWYGGVGVVSRAAGVTERYFLFAPAPGGFQVGNPTLDPEVKVELTVGAQWRGDRLLADASLFGSRVNDYIAEISLASEDVNGDQVPDRIRGFQNVDAELYGGEVTLDLRVSEWLSVPATLAYVRGRNVSDSRDLPEMPPLNGTAALRAVSERVRSGWIEAGIQFEARQDRVDETFPEDPTPSWYALHLKGGLALRDGLALEVGVENLLDEEYHRHLTREALMPVGDLAAGDEIPEPGRFVYVTVTYAM